MTNCGRDEVHDIWSDLTNKLEADGVVCGPRFVGLRMPVLPCHKLCLWISIEVKTVVPQRLVDPMKLTK